MYRLLISSVFVITLVLFIGSGAVIAQSDTKNKEAAASEEIEGKEEAKAGKININTANAEQLMQIPGVGEGTAANIIDYRNKNGDFKTLDQLKEVQGVGEKKYEKMKDMLTM